MRFAFYAVSFHNAQSLIILNMSLCSLVAYAFSLMLFRCCCFIYALLDVYR